MADNNLREHFHPDYVCPACHGLLRIPDSTSLRCEGCGAVYEYEAGVADFSNGRYYDNFTPGQELPPAHVAELQQEISGAESRISDFYLPLLRRRLRPKSVNTGPARVLDCGCGNGVAVDLLNAVGFESWGNDPSALRKWQWRERRSRQHLFVADGAKLPFRDGFFEAVISSGVLEHVGVSETGGETYRVKPRADRDERRQDFLRELLRVVAPDGCVWIDFPNGAFPIDFWHGTTGECGARWHRLHEGFLPRVGDVKRYVAAIDKALGVRALSPHKRLRLMRIRRHWYGRLFNLPARLFLWAIGLPFTQVLAGTWINPYLVIEISKANANPPSSAQMEKRPRA